MKLLVIRHAIAEDREKFKKAMEKWTADAATATMSTAVMAATPRSRLIASSECR